MKETIEELFLQIWEVIAKPITFIITGLAFGFMFTSYKGMQSDNYIIAALLLTLSYAWCVFLFWLNFIKDSIWEG